MRVKFTLGAYEEPEAYAKVHAIVDVLSGQAQAVRSGGAVVAAAVAEAETLAKLEAENPQFGKQPLPEGATDGPLAPPSPPSAPSPADAAPSTSAPAAPPVSSVAEVDKNGLPWDERIHASSRAKIADGSWRMKRGVDPAKVTEVEAQLRAQIPAAAPPPPKADPLDNLKPEPAAPPGPPAPPAAPVAGAGLTFGQLAKRVGAKITLGELTAQDLAAKMAALGFPGGLHEANARPDMWATILETLGA